MKHRLFKRLLAGLILIVLSHTASAQSFRVGRIYYHVLSSTGLTVEVVMGNSFYSGNITIPSTVTYNGTTYTVVALGEMAFYGATLSGVSIPPTVTRIGDQCFLFATGPTTITLPASVAEVGMQALASYHTTAILVDDNNPHFRSVDGLLFSHDTATLVACPTAKSGTLVLPQATRHIAPCAFNYCQNLSSVSLPQGLASIGTAAFIYCSRLNDVSLPSSVSHIGANPFAACAALDRLSLEEGNTHYFMEDLAIYTAGGDTLVSCHKSSDTLLLPPTLRALNGLACNTDIRHVQLPDSVSTIGEQAFIRSSLQSIDMPDGLSSLGDFAFQGCEGLVRVGMPPTLERMGYACFEGCASLPSIVIPDGLGTIPMEAFYFCESLSQISWGDAVSVIDSFAFGGCAFTELVLPATLRSVRMGAFAGYDNPTLRRVSFTAAVDTVEPETFTDQSLGMLRFANTVPPVTTTAPEYGIVDYGCLYMASADSIAIPCGSRDAWLADEYWEMFADQYVEDCNGIDSKPELEVSVYPNPAADRLHIRFADNGSKRRIELLNALGATAWVHETDGSSADLVVGHLERGAYLLRIVSANGTATAKVILQ